MHLQLWCLMPYDRCLSNSRMVSVCSPCSCSSFQVDCFETRRTTSHHRMLRASTVTPEEDMSGDSLLQSPCCSLRYSSFVAMSSYFPPQSSIEIQVQDDQMSISFLGHCNTFTDLPYFSRSGRAPISSTIGAQSTQGSHGMMLHSDSDEDAYRVDVS